jgi:broad specificity phosphatase PhoE
VPYLYLIRHPQTRPDPAIPASRWTLSAEGRAQVRVLVAMPHWKGIAAVYTSLQDKAAIVGSMLHAARNVPHAVRAGLDEARRDQWLGAEAFEAAQRAFFAHPETPPAPEWEPAGSARVRFGAVMEAILRSHPPDASLAVVTHASVLTLYVAGLRGEPPSYDLWRSIDFAAIMAVDRATMRPATPFLVPPYEGLPAAGNPST